MCRAKPVADRNSLATLDAHALRGVHVLVADDSFDNQALVKRILRRSGAHVELAGNGIEAVQKALNEDHDIILMDMQMPMLDGCGATRELRRLGYERPLIALTAHAMREEREKSLAAGCNDHLAKPVNFARLIELVGQHVTRHDA